VIFIVNSESVNLMT